MTTSTYTSAYERRLKMVEDVLSDRTELDGKAARDLAVRVLSALDHIPGTTETDPERLLELGRAKRRAKGADLLVVNRVGWRHGFAADENAVSVIGADDAVAAVASGTKMSVAHAILDVIAARLAPGSEPITKDTHPV